MTSASSAPDFENHSELNPAIASAAQPRKLEARAPQRKTASEMGSLPDTQEGGYEGRVTSAVTVCPNCHGTGLTRFGVCTYCNGTGK
jgi:DnaJ-class molecular chaperone